MEIPAIVGAGLVVIGAGIGIGRIGGSAMDAIALLENLQVNVKVKLKGSGTVKSQSVDKHQKLKPNQTIVLEAS